MGGNREWVDIGGGWLQQVGAGGRKRTWVGKWVGER